MRQLLVIILALIIAGCSWQQEIDPMVLTACPALTPLTDPSFGATTLKLIEVAGQYRECRCAALSCDK